MFGELVLFILQVMFAANASQIDRYVDCGSHATVTSVNLTPAETDIHGIYFILKDGHSYTFTVAFSPTEDFDSNLTNVLNFKMTTINVPMRIDRNPCQDNNVKCPLKVGSTYNYNLTFVLPEQWIDMRVAAKFQLHDQSQDKDVICFVLPVLTRAE